MKSLVDLCLFCVANNLSEIKNAGNFLSRADKEILVERLCDHDMLSADRLPIIKKHLFSPQLQTISLRYNCDQVTDAVLANLASCGCQLRSLTIKSCHKLTDKGMSNFCKTQKQLEYLNIKGNSLNQLTDKWFSHLRSPCLSTLIIKGLDITANNNGIQMLVKNCPQIHELRLQRCSKLSDGAIEIITFGLAENLEILDVKDARLLTDMSLRSLGNGNCYNLKELYMQGCNLISGNGLKLVALGCPKLEHLDVSYCYRAMQDGMSFLPVEAFPDTLVELNVYGVQLPENLIISLVKRLTHIKTMRLCGIQAITDDVLESVCASAGKTLLELDLSACAAITDSGFSSIHRHCRVLESLMIYFSHNLTGKKLEPLFTDHKRANEIREIGFNGCKNFSEDTIRLIVMSCPNLEMLHVAGIKNVDDELLMSMASNCPKLVKVNLKGCDQVTDNGICELVRFCPISCIVVSGIHSLTDKSVFALTNSCTSTLKEVYASACSKITIQAINYLKDCCLSRIYVEHRTPNLDPGQLMAKNLDTGEFCRADLLVQAHATTFPESLRHETTIESDFLHRLMSVGLR